MSMDTKQTTRDWRATVREQTGEPSCAGSFIESLEPRLMIRHSYAWGGWTQQIGLDQLVANYPAVTGKGESIAVIDTGIDWNHPALGNGKLGYGAKVRAGWNFVDNNANYMDTDGHGTAVAGMIAADPYIYMNRRYQGVAPQAQLLALKVDTGNSPNNAAMTARIRAALQWVIYYKARYNIVAVNISEGPTTPISQKATNRDYGDLLLKLSEMGVFVAAAAGNEGVSNGVDWPGADPNVIAVSSVDVNDKISVFSDTGYSLDLLAPGEAVVAPTLDSNGNPIYAALSGTSFASPIVAGAAALIKMANPAFSTQQILATMENTGVSDTDAESGLSFERLDLFGAVSYTVRAARRARHVRA
jgi:subtilisin family serine protease